MAEVDELRAAEHLIAQGMPVKAQPILWKLKGSKDSVIALNAGLALIAALDHATQNDKLLQITDESLAIATALRKKDIFAFLLIQKAEFLFRKLSLLFYQQQNLKLAARAFRWIDFSLKEDKAEYAAIEAERARLETDIAILEAGVVTETQSNADHYFQGKILTGLAEVSFSRYMYHVGLLIDGGPWKSKIMNLYFVRRWNFNSWVGYDREARRKLRDSFGRAVAFYERGMEEFVAGNYKSDAAHTAYALALKHALTFHFSKARKYLNLTKSMANAVKDKNLFIHIADLEKLIKDGNRHPRNWVEEFGMDLPRALRNKVGI
ncbi:MAG TPA: hypothetical protein VKV95_09880 [Terriglobia bacterium]|nr:hypothetical protein [Terriglobia bacterium]